MLQTEVVYNGRDNHIELELRENGVNIIDYTPITRVRVTFYDGSLIDSDNNPEWFDWSGNSLIIKAGLANLAPGNYTARVETWDMDNQDGIVWTELLCIRIRA